MEMTVLSPGLLATVQDLGRPGHRRQGVASGGAMDAFALQVANLLVGNAGNAPVLEFALTGPRLKFSGDALIALCGGEFGDLPDWRLVRVRAGGEISLEKCRAGCRGYLAVAGGFDVPRVLGGCGTDLRGGFGGHEGRALRAGDILKVKRGVLEAHTMRPDAALHHFIAPEIRPAYSRSPTVRVVRGTEAGEYSGEFFQHLFTVETHSDRMGLRLTGPHLERRAKAGELVSSPVTPGTIQVPPDGQPIVLMADAQTLGGYPKIAHAISVDLPLLAQLRPGDTVRFQEVALAEAHRLRLAREHTLAILREGLAAKLH
ncbi:MAG TPA: biotin-dependent carboxyltransferase family protein [Opitutaceae bacterium]|jgi:antagonist of KipI|nr:biotin-dependent carboxyltransferase family protein [Opitutaceae bacterium]